MLINWHAHAEPPEQAAAQRHWGNRSPATIENLLAIHEAAGIDMAVVTNPVHYVKGKSPAEALALIQRANEYAAEIAQRHPDRTVVFATGIPGGGAPMLKELERAIGEYGLRGVMINSSHNGEYPDADHARGFFELVTALDVPVMVHAPAWSYGEECMQMYRLISSVGRPVDETLALARMIVRGIWEQFPTLKLIGAHLGGGICGVIGRMNYAYELQEEAFFLGKYEPMLIKHEPLHYLKMMYMDTASYHPPTIMCALRTIGVDHLLFGADAPPLSSLLPRARKIIEELPIDDADKTAILGGNAAKLLNLDVAAAR